VTAYSWDNEAFTRLILEDLRQSGARGYKLVISHHPIKSSYSGVFDYARIIVPLLEDEWFCTSADFKERNTTRGKILQCVFVEQLQDNVAYALDVVIPSSKSWSKCNPKAFKKVTLFLQESVDKIIF